MIQTIYNIYQSVLLQSGSWAHLLCQHHVSNIYVLLAGPFGFAQFQSRQIHLYSETVILKLSKWTIKRFVIQSFQCCHANRLYGAL